MSTWKYFWDLIKGIVHAHDFFSPGRVSKSVVVRFKSFLQWTDVLQAFLTYKKGSEVLQTGSYMHIWITQMPSKKHLAYISLHSDGPGALGREMNQRHRVKKNFKRSPHRAFYASDQDSTAWFFLLSERVRRYTYFSQENSLRPHFFKRRHNHGFFGIILVSVVLAIISFFMERSNVPINNGLSQVR